jgi:hypothetical protein
MNPRSNTLRQTQILGTKAQTRELGDKALFLPYLTPQAGVFGIDFRNSILIALSFEQS